MLKRKKKNKILHVAQRFIVLCRGVVQLFSAIEKHRTMMQVKLSQCRSIMGREKVLESTGKEAFLDILKQQGKRVKEEMDPEGNKVKEKNDHLKEVSDVPYISLLPPCHHHVICLIPVLAALYMP